MHFLCWLLPLSIKILSNKRAPSIAQDHTIRIDHGHDLKYEVIPEYPSLNARSNKVIYDSLHHVRCSCFSWVHSGTENDGFLLLHLLLAVCESRNCEHIAGITSIGLAEHLSPQPVFGLRVVLKLSQVPLHVCVGVGIAVSKVNSVIIMLKLNTKSQSVVVAGLLSFD
jgi:hypothetical protein